MANTRTNPVRRVSREEALLRLANKEVTPAYRGPRGNAEIDRHALNVTVGASERVLTHSATAGRASTGASRGGRLPPGSRPPAGGPGRRSRGGGARQRRERPW